MKTMKKLTGWLTANILQAKALFAALFISLAVMGQTAHAALPESVTNAINAAKTDGLEAGWLVVGVIAALFVIAIVKRLMR
ncbi:major capsid protein [Conchiformibius steedae]|uniref:major capsid protein n=1 Tax=Conchiformibius steedae TaxID=153493 RepID=UPI0026EAA4CA|nr:major capsid protein [Conchiformibius steedae]